MGAYFTFKCDCGYSAHVSGMPDSGFFAMTITVTCDDCKEIGDITIETKDEKRKDNIGKCRECGGTNLRGWGQKDRYDEGEGENYDCPKCEGQMSIDESAGVTMWD